MNWIKVAKELPKKEGRYLTCDIKGNIHVRGYYEGQVCPFGISPNHPHLFVPEWWAELPELPKEVRR